MAQEAKIPGSFWARVQKMIDDSITKFARSGFLRNASISGGAGLSIKDGGALTLDNGGAITLNQGGAITLNQGGAVTLNNGASLALNNGGAATIAGGGSLTLQTAQGVGSFYVGPVNPALADGSPQPGMIVRRQDGTIAMMLWDPSPTTSGYTQFLGIYDRAGHAIFTDDTTSGSGIARPHLAHAFYPSRAQDFPKSTATAYETIFRAKVEKQQPKLYVEAWGYCDTAGATGLIQVLVNGAVWGSPVAVDNSIVKFLAFGPAVVSGNFGDTLTVEIQVKRAAGTGSVLVGAAWVQSTQS